MASQRPPSFHCITKTIEAKSDYLPLGSLSSLNGAGVPGNDLLSHYPRIFGILIKGTLWACFTGAGIKRVLILFSSPLSIHLTFIFLLLFGCFPDPRTQTNKLSYHFHSTQIHQSFLTTMWNIWALHSMPASAHPPIGKKNLSQLILLESKWRWFPSFMSPLVFQKRSQHCLNLWHATKMHRQYEL